MADSTMNPDPVVLCKLGSMIVHAEEFMSPHGHPLDKMAFDDLMRDPQVQKWLAGMRKAALIPEKRNG